MALKTRMRIWALWAVILVFSAAYLAFSLKSFRNIKSGSEKLLDFYATYAEEIADIFGKSFQKTLDDQVVDTRNCLMAMSLLGFLVILAWIIFSFLILLGGPKSRIPHGYGVMMGTCLHTGIVMLMVAIVLHTQRWFGRALKNELLRYWSTSDYQIYVATFSLSYALFGVYLLAFIVLMFAFPALNKDTDSRGEHYTGSASLSTAASPPAMTSGTASGIQSSNGFGANWGAV